MNSREKVQHAELVSMKAGKRLPKGIVSSGLWNELERRSFELTKAADARDAAEEVRDGATQARNEARAGLAVAYRKAKAQLVTLEADGIIDVPAVKSASIEGRLQRARSLVRLAGRRLRLGDLEAAIERLEKAHEASLEANNRLASEHSAVDAAEAAWTHAYRVVRSAVETALIARGLSTAEVRRELRAVFGRRKQPKEAEAPDASKPANPTPPKPDAANPAV